MQNTTAGPPMTSPMVMAPPPLAPPAIDSTMGAWLLGTLFAMLLQGIGYHQTYRYFRLYPKDPRYMKLWIIVSQIVETAITALSIQACYYNLITNYFNPTIFLEAPVWSMRFLPVPGSIAALITQTFFARRVYMIDRRFRPVAIIATILTLAFTVCYCALTGLGWNAANINEFLKYSWLASLGSSLIMVADLMLTSVLIYFLRTNRTGVTRTDSLLDILIMYAISSGLVICVFNILNVAFSLAWSDNLVYAAISMILTKLYSNSFLVSLNARQSLINRGVVMEGTTPFTSTVLGKRSTNPVGKPRRVAVPLDIHQETVTTAATDRSSDIELKMVPPAGESLTDVESTLGKKDRATKDVALTV
ncbi:hypothetical protein C8Q80DRAFT_1196714 [Daedaleopsis nitida]|nr:hypothetical protein C8Q80DRAFT_1196714 [Daedaleopsis nitida]